jgi:hypothetical protein
LFYKGNEKHYVEYPSVWNSNCGYTNVNCVVFEPILNFTSDRGYTLKNKTIVTNNVFIMELWSAMHIGGTPSDFTSSSHWTEDSELKVTYAFNNSSNILAFVV